ncbi:MAG: 16S rRNA (uracil(1498)-N(3))-methyltransferase [Candidatus Aminicenantes bacterium]|nr:16S rRNA (uracil(1498)-N(3))-methyltransferase [Candidatus Aminicenantes bacterium]MDH5715104.1 16S rRNA (uracil(1498)-N(3))-methyltransferase [Candidatus Aminicenantes bacterium]
MTTPRFYLTSKELKKGVAVLSGEQFHHLVRVRRGRVGDKVRVFDEQGREFEGKVSEIRKDRAVILLVEKCLISAPPSIEITLLQALPKGRKMDLIVQKTTELGVWKIIPLITERTIVRLPRPDRVARWNRIALESCRQSQRRSIPLVSPITRLEELDLASLSGLKIILCEGAERGLKEALKGTTENKVVLMVGPEGGWSPREIELSLQWGFITAGLGRRILRTETAGIIGVALVQYERGDLGFSLTL